MSGDKRHVIMHRSLYEDIRTKLITEIFSISDHFLTLSTDVQFLQIMSNSPYICTREVTLGVQGHA